MEVGKEAWVVMHDNKRYSQNRFVKLESMFRHFFSINSMIFQKTEHMNNDVFHHTLLLVPVVVFASNSNA